MILRDTGCVFVHIPKTAGITISRALYGGDLPSVSGPPDYEIAHGWCPTRRVWLQHLTVEEMLHFELLSEDELDEMFVFAVTRNPFDRAVSDFYFLRRHNYHYGRFTHMIERTGRWDVVLNDTSTSRYRGDHLRPQSDYVHIGDNDVCDYVGRFEQLADVEYELNTRGLLRQPFAHSNAGSSTFDHYSRFYSDSERDLIAQTYALDLERFSYSFDDRRTTRTRVQRPSRRLRRGVGPRIDRRTRRLAKSIDWRGSSDR